MREVQLELRTPLSAVGRGPARVLFSVCIDAVRQVNIDAKKRLLERAALDANVMAERVGFEPTHALRRLTDFESAPLGHLGTSPQAKIIIP